ncbi:hypothetical protein SteCoe_8225 [Stentor coeruleus]|uniref:B box-type domain-containing protein n=1 Tax=Stentor coeruleus TaxID=5963 RepID=A0A1R2CKR0_9CILI|nr:hypothetical protein SteCoe_8225 [Stentor coeruleus]
MKCEDCIKQKAQLICIECEELFCLSCDSSIHKGGKRKFHSRLPVCSNCKSPAILECKDCNSRNCTNCKHFHNGHHTVYISSPRSLGVFWDISNFSSQPFSINDALVEISYRISNPKFIKLYSDNWIRSKIPNIAEIVFRYGICPLDALFLDVSLLANSGLTHILIIAPQVLELREKLLHLKATSTKIMIAMRTGPLVFYETNEETSKIFDERKGAVWDMGLVIEKSFYVNCQQCKVKDVCQYLAQEAEFGRIMVERTEVVEKISNKLRISYEESNYLLDLARSRRLVNEIEVKYSSRTYTLYSIKVPYFCYKVLYWVLNSLKLDEISPLKRIIKSRLKKVFSLHLLNNDWDKIIRKIQSRPRSNSFSSNPSTECFRKIKKKLFNTFETWLGLESLKTDFFNIKSSDYWDEYLNFFERYFSNNYKEIIPMGRYGCSLLLKLSGPDSLKSLSLGKLFHITNLAIQDDYFRYQNKCLIWSKDFKFLDNLSFKKLEDMKKNIITLLSQYPQGLNISCIPALLKKKLHVVLNFQDFGYTKLKEFLISISEIQLNLQIASIKVKPVIDKNQIAEIIAEIVKEKEYGVTESILQATLQIRVNQSIDWTIYDVASCEEFVKKYSRSSIEVLRTPEYNILFKANEFKTYSYFFPFKSLFTSAVLESSRVPTPQIYHPISHSVDLNITPRNSVTAPMQRMINISNVPSEMIQKSPFRDSEPEEGRYAEPFIAEDLSVVLDNKSNGFRSIQHSKDSSIDEWHLRTSSFEKNNDNYSTIYMSQPNRGHSRLNFSWFDKPLCLD